MSRKANYRSVRKNRFTQISNDFLWDKNISLQAKGLLSIFLSNSDDWELNMKEIIKRSKNGRDAHYKVINELIDHGYFARVEVRGKSEDGKEGFESMEYLFSDNKADVENELENIEIYATNEKKQIFIEYKDRTDKKKKSKSKINKTLHTENQDAEKTLHTENQDAENQDAENEDAGNQYINNTKGNNNNLNNTKCNNTNIKKEEETNIYDNIAYEVLKDFLQKNKIDQKTINLTIEELKNRNIDIFMMKDVESQFTHMMDKLTYGEIDNHNGFATYFVNGLQMRTAQSNASRQYQEQKLREYEQIIHNNQKKDTDLYFNWLEESENEVLTE